MALTAAALATRASARLALRTLPGLLKRSDVSDTRSSLLVRFHVASAAALLPFLIPLAIRLVARSVRVAIVASS
jgi:hypothetical protein